MRTSFLKPVIGIALVVGVALGVTSAAGAATTTNVVPNPVTMAPNQTVADVTVNWTGGGNRTLMFLDICFKSITDPTFDVALDCGAFSGTTPNGTTSGSGSSVLEIFRGQDPAGENWGCFAPGDTAPAGVTKYTTCYVRVTDNVSSNNDNDSQQAFTIVESSGAIPEAPLTILLPVVGLLAAMGGFILIRNRQTLTV